MQKQTTNTKHESKCSKLEPQYSSLWQFKKNRSRDVPLAPTKTSKRSCWNENEFQCIWHVHLLVSFLMGLLPPVPTCSHGRSLFLHSAHKLRIRNHNHITANWPPTHPQIHSHIVQGVAPIMFQAVAVATVGSTPPDPSLGISSAAGAADGGDLVKSAPALRGQAQHCRPLGWEVHGHVASSILQGTWWMDPPPP
jgi:hypothetical protein